MILVIERVRVIAFLAEVGIFVACAGIWRCAYCSGSIETVHKSSSIIVSFIAGSRSRLSCPESPGESPRRSFGFYV